MSHFKKEIEKKSPGIKRFNDKAECLKTEKKKYISFIYHLDVLSKCLILLLIFNAN